MAIAPYISKVVLDECATKLFQLEGNSAAELLAISSFMSKPAIDACAKEIIEREGKEKLVFIASIMSKNAIDEVGEMSMLEEH